MKRNWQSGVTLIETIVFLVVVSIALAGLLKVFNSAVVSSTDPVVRVRALEIAQAQLDEILARKFDENTPVGGVPACGSSGAPVCLGVSPDGDFDDVGDYSGFIDNSKPGHAVSVSVVNAGTDLGLTSGNAKLVSVTVTYEGDQLVLSAYKVNF